MSYTLSPFTGAELLNQEPGGGGVMFASERARNFCLCVCVCARMSGAVGAFAPPMVCFISAFWGGGEGVLSGGRGAAPAGDGQPSLTPPHSKAARVLWT